MRYFSFQEIICMLLIFFYLIGVIIDIYKKRYKDFHFLLSLFILTLTSVITFVVAPAFVMGPSMEPTLNNKDILFINKIDRNYTINDIVVLRSKSLNKSIIKRIVAKGGDTVCMVDGNLYVNNELVTDDEYSTIPTFESFDEVTVPEGHYFVLGDNRPVSLDSRSEKVGFIAKKYIYGKVIK